MKISPLCLFSNQKTPKGYPHESEGMFGRSISSNAAPPDRQQAFSDWRASAEEAKDIEAQFVRMKLEVKNKKKDMKDTLEAAAVKKQEVNVAVSALERKAEQLRQDPGPARAGGEGRTRVTYG
jgi:hypothetical protein